MPKGRPKRKQKPAVRTGGQSFVVPGRRTELTEAIAREITERIANCASFRDACDLSGVTSDTGQQWLEKGRAKLPANGDQPEIYILFARLVEAAKSRRRTMLKLLIRRAAQGTERKPGDWRAAHALGAISDPKEFVPQLRVHVTSELAGALDRVEKMFGVEPEKVITHAQALELAMRAMAGGGADEGEEEGEA